MTEDGKHISYKDQHILKEYPEYREEQYNHSLLKYYAFLHNEKDIYEYPVLQNKNEIQFNRKLTKKLFNKPVDLFSCNPSILPSPDNNKEYIINIRWINYDYNMDGSKKTIPSQWVSLNSRFKLNTQFQQITKEVFLEENFEKERNNGGIGLEDIRLFYFEPENQIYYSATCFDDSRKCTNTSCDKYSYHPIKYQLKRNNILCDFYDIHKCKKYEKNWSYFNYNNQLRVVYKWFPISIGKINFEKSQLSIVEYKYQVPDFFKDTRGSTPGITFQNEIWFILHKVQHYQTLDKNIAYNYQHYFAIFDMNMNLLRYSELFKFKGAKVEFCIGFIIEETRIIISYSALDTNCFIAIYEKETLDNQLKWYRN